MKKKSLLSYILLCVTFSLPVLSQSNSKIDYHAKGKVVANQINERYRKTTSSHQDKPAYYDTGVMEAMFTKNDAVTTAAKTGWFGKDANAGAFSYLRVDITDRAKWSKVTYAAGLLYSYNNYYVGFTVFPKDALKENNVDDYFVISGYVMDAWTGSRSYSHGGRIINNEGISDLLTRSTIDDFYKKTCSNPDYAKNPLLMSPKYTVSAFRIKDFDQSFFNTSKYCGFKDSNEMIRAIARYSSANNLGFPPSPYTSLQTAWADFETEPKNFDIVIDGTARYVNDDYNEINIKDFQNDNVAKRPVESIFILKPFIENEKYVTLAKNEQKAFWDAGRFVPILIFDAEKSKTDSGSSPFIYSETLNDIVNIN